MEIKENMTMTTIELLKEVQQAQLECMIRRLPVHITINVMPEFCQVGITIQKSDHEVLWNEIATDHPLRRSQTENILKEFESVISEYTAAKQAG